MITWFLHDAYGAWFPETACSTVLTGTLTDEAGLPLWQCRASFALQEAGVRGYSYAPASYRKPPSRRWSSLFFDSLRPDEILPPTIACVASALLGFGRFASSARARACVSVRVCAACLVCLRLTTCIARAFPAHHMPGAINTIPTLKTHPHDHSAPATSSDSRMLV